MDVLEFFLPLRYPKSVWFILGTELCERFSFYGFKAILALYLKNYLRMSEDTATAMVHAFIFAAYSSPIFGGWLSDSFLGKFWTIFCLALVYSAGNIVTAITAIPGVTGTPPHWWGVAIGLFLVAFGTGGIKPCVSSFGGDQFASSDNELMTSFFAVFYLSINLGSTASTFFTPLLRNYFGYPLAFSCPAILLVTATIIFALGYRWYKKNPPAGNVFTLVMKIIFTAIAQCCRRDAKQPPVKHWLDRANVRYTQQQIDDVKTIGSIIKCLLPLAIFWSLFDQHSTRFVFQAEKMNKQIGPFTFTSDQIGTLNPLILIIMIPIFDRIVYPLARRIGLRLYPLRKVTIGFAFTALSFVASGVLDACCDRWPGQIPVGFQLIQYLLLACGEVLVSITSLEFAYSQAPKYLKSVIQSFYLLTTAVGNAVVVIVSKSSLFSAQAYEFFFYAIAMLLTTIVFLILVHNYRYVNTVYDADEKTDSSATSENNGADPRTK